MDSNPRFGEFVYWPSNGKRGVVVKRIKPCYARVVWEGDDSTAFDYEIDELLTSPPTSPPKRKVLMARAVWRHTNYDDSYWMDICSSPEPQPDHPITFGTVTWEELE